MRKFFVFSFQLSAGLLCGLASAADLIPIDPLWKSEAFRKAFTGSYGIDARIEPKVTTGEKAVLEAAAKELADKDRDGAVKKLSSSSLLKNSPALLFALGNLRFEQGKIDDATGNFNAALKLYPNFRDTHRNLAIALVQQNAYKKAEPHLTRAIELGAQDGLTMGLLGYVHANANRHQAALQAFRLAQLTMPMELQWKFGEAHALLSLENPRGAASIYKELIMLKPAEAGLWLNQADAFLQLDETEKGIANLEFARRLGKLGAEETISLGHLYLNESLPEAAVVRYTEAIERGENPPALAPSKAIDALVYLTQFRCWKDARGISEKIGAVFGEKINADEKQRSRFERSQALIELEIGDAAQGAKLVEGILERNPVDGQALILFAQFRLREQKPEEAIMLLEQAARVPENEAEALRIHGQLLVNRGDYKAALELLERVLEIAPDDGMAEYVAAIREFVK